MKFFTIVSLTITQKIQDLIIFNHIRKKILLQCETFEFIVISYFMARVSFLVESQKSEFIAIIYHSTKDQIRLRTKLSCLMRKNIAKKR